MTHNLYTQHSRITLLALRKQVGKQLLQAKAAEHCARTYMGNIPNYHRDKCEQLIALQERYEQIQTAIAASETSHPYLSN